MVKLGQGLVLVIVAIVMFAVIALGVNVHEKGECEKWRNEASQGFTGYYFTAWQVEQCEAQGLNLPAILKEAGGDESEADRLITLIITTQ